MSMAITSGAVGTAVTAAQAAPAGSAPETLVLKKAIDIQASGALQLIAAIPAPPPLATSGTLGTRLNTFA